METEPSEIGRSRHRPYTARIKSSYNLCLGPTRKTTHHVVLDLKDSGLTYRPGDCIGILPEHDPELIRQTLNVLKASGDETVLDRSGFEWRLEEFLSHRAGISQLNSKIVKAVAEKERNIEMKGQLLMLLQKENRLGLKAFMEETDLHHFLADHPEVRFNFQEICDLLPPLLPRLYSIASSQMQHPDEVHLTVGLVDYERSCGKPRKGVCSHFLCHLAPSKERAVSMYVHPHSGFTIPEDQSTDIIMIGPGTGIAPFRSFLQERRMMGAKGRNWLFFGEWNRKHHFFYEEDWNHYIKNGSLSVDLAFSRDQEEKVYVQHRMLEKAKELYRWIDSGASVFVCGDAKRMAKDVEVALLQIFEKEGGLSPDDAKLYLKKLRQEKRYLRDVY